jgi:hypothetical protein
MEVHRPRISGRVILRRVSVMRRMRASGGAFPGAGAQGVLDDLVDGTGTPTAFCAAAEAAVHQTIKAVFRVMLDFRY